MNKKIEIINAYKEFQNENTLGLNVLDNISFSIEEGQCVSLIGPSGCGKSTLLRAIAGLENLTSGIIKIDGKVVSKPQVGIGIVFQDYSSFPWLTVKENINLGLHSLNKNNNSQKIINDLGLSGFEDYYFSQLSGGMKQRVAVGRALLNSQSLLLMDEPLGALDIKNRLLLQNKIRTLLQKNNTTALLISHDVDEALMMSDKIIILSDRPTKILFTLDIPKNKLKTTDSKFLLLKKEINNFLLK